MRAISCQENKTNVFLKNTTPSNLQNEQKALALVKDVQLPRSSDVINGIFKHTKMPSQQDANPVYSP